MMMNQSNGEKRGDLYNNRLFSSLLLQKGLRVTQFLRIKDNVQLLKTENGEKILKGFQSKTDLLFQCYFLKNLNQKSPQSFVLFEHFPNGDIYLKFNKRYWGIMTFINGKSLNFGKTQDQSDAFNALQQFHNSNQGIKVSNIDRYYMGLLRRYESRLCFLRQAIQLFPHHYRGMFNEILKWGNYSLTELSQEPIDEMERQAAHDLHWIHGDVADHNFIRNDDKKVFLIDFDLVSIAPQSYDYLQLAHRILVNNGWDMEELIKFIPIIEKLTSNRWFLCALLFPNDIIREWKHWFNGRLQMDMQFLLEYSEQQFLLRAPVVRQIIHMLD